MLPHTPKEVPTVEEKELRLLVRKGIYLYDYMDSLEKMNEEQLPPKEAFFSSLTNANITDDDYAHPKEVWNTFNVRTMRDYHELYMRSMSTIFSASFTQYRSLFDYLFISNTH